MYKNMSNLMVRKNFVIKKEVANHLQELAIANNKSATAIVQDLIETSYENIAYKKRKQAFESLKGCLTGIIGNKTFKELRAQRIKEKYSK